jgi:hypothetical protein
MRTNKHIQDLYKFDQYNQNKQMASWICDARGHANSKIIYASKLAVISGFNPYESADAFRAAYAHSIGLNPSYVDPSKVARDEIEKLAPIEKEQVQKVTNTVFKSAADVQAAISTLKQEQKLTLEMEKEIKTQAYTRHGQEQEDVVRKNTNVLIKTDNKFVVSKLPIFTIGEIDYYIGGKHDGMLDGVVIEIKTRQRRFLGVPVYERVQIHAYMHIYKTRKGRLVESFNGERKEHDIEFDDEFWREVVQKTQQGVPPPPTV